jgi:hypothetical protein
MQHEFATRSADETMATMAEAPSVNHVPVLTGGSAVIRRCSRYIGRRGLGAQARTRRSDATTRPCRTRRMT